MNALLDQEKKGTLKPTAMATKVASGGGGGAHPISHYLKVSQEEGSPPASTSGSRGHQQQQQQGSDDLLEYVGYLEKEVGRLRLERDAAESRHQEEKRRLKEGVNAALDKLDDTRRKMLAHKHHHSLMSARDKIFEEKIEKLELELEMKNELINRRRKKEEKAMKQLEKENELLKKKSTLGWMLGCLSEVYLQSGPNGEVDPLLKMVRNIQRELERENVVLSYSNEPPHIQLEYVEKEIRRLIDCARLVQNDGTSTSFHKDTIDRKESLRGDATQRTDRSLEKVNPRTNEEDEGPNARFIINCFNNGGSEAVAATPKYAESIESRSTQIEVFEANPSANVEHTRLSGSTWAEVKVMNTREAERAELLHCHSDIKKMLCDLQASFNKYVNIASGPPTGNAYKTRSLANFLRPPSPIPKKNRSSSAPKFSASCSRAPICPKPKSKRFT